MSFKSSANIIVDHSFDSPGPIGLKFGGICSTDQPNRELLIYSYVTHQGLCWLVERNLADIGHTPQVQPRASSPKPRRSSDSATAATPRSESPGSRAGSAYRQRVSSEQASCVLIVAVGQVHDQIEVCSHTAIKKSGEVESPEGKASRSKSASRFTQRAQDAALAPAVLLPVEGSRAGSAYRQRVSSEQARYVLIVVANRCTTKLKF